MNPTRRLLLAGLAALPAANAAPAGASWEGTWAGTLRGAMMQIIIAGDEVIGFYWPVDYVEVRRFAFSADRSALTIEWSGGSVRVNLASDRKATAIVHPTGRPPVTASLARE